MKTSSKTERSRVRVGCGRLVRAEHLRLMTGQALAGMLANPEWMALAKEECKRPGCGHDVPKFFGELAAMYADRALTEADEISKLYSPNVKAQPRAERGEDQ